jgi:sulfur relay (sulfurtransferase) complex TusBCD TusD component (DsrE family)
MNVNELMSAATLAEELSRFRHKKIRLILTPEGVSVDGKLIRPDGVVIQRYQTELKWAQGDAAALEMLVRHIDRKLVAEWCNAEPVDDH